MGYATCELTDGFDLLALAQSLFGKLALGYFRKHALMRIAQF